MIRFYNQNKRDIETYIGKFDMQKHTYKLNVSETYGLSYYRQLDSELKEFFNNIEPTNSPTLFIIEGDFSLLSRLSLEDKSYYMLSVINIFASYLFTDESTEGERRLAPTKELKNVRLSEMVKLDMVNRKLKFPIFSIKVIDTDTDIDFKFEVL